MHNINDLAIYNERMRKSLYTKLWFIDKYLNWDSIDTIIDFGCADGSMIEALRFFFPTKKIVGIDINEDMRELTKNKTGCKVYESFEELEKEVALDRAFLVLSSVIHEVFTYCGDEAVKALVDTAYKCKAVALREMVKLHAYDESDCLARMETRYKIINGSDAGLLSRLNEHESVWGRIDNVGIESANSFRKWLLSMNYIENWNRELHENYLPYTKDEYLRMFRKAGFKSMRVELKTSEYIRKSLKDMFSYDIDGVSIHLLAER